MAMLLGATFAGAGVAQAGHSYHSSSLYCGINSSLNAATVAVGAAIRQTLTFCQRYTGWSTSSAYLGGSRLDIAGPLHLSAGTWGSMNLYYSFAAPGYKDVLGYLRSAYEAYPSPSFHHAYDHVRITVVGNPTTPVVAEDHVSGWSAHSHPRWSWSAAAAYGSIARYEVDPSWRSSFTTTSTEYHPTLPSGVWSLRVRAQNNVGVWGPWSSFVAAHVDVTPPATSLSLSGTAGAAGWYRSAVTAALSASDAHSGVASTLRSLDGGAYTTYGGPFAIGGDGVHSLAYYSTDRAGNAEAAKSATVRVDTTPPATAASASGRVVGGWYPDGAAVSLAGADAASGVSYTERRVDGGAWATHSAPFALASSGRHVVEYRSVDVAGNAEVVRSLSVPVDRDAPVTSASFSGLAGDAGWFRSDVVASLSASDAWSGVARTEAALDGASAAPVAGRVGVAGDGVHALAYRSVDRAGHAEAWRSAVVRVDATPPESRLVVDGPSASTGDTTFVTSASAASLASADATSDVASSWLALEGARVDGAGPISLSGVDGPRLLEYGSRDVAGNVEATRSATLFLDDTPPASRLEAAQPSRVADGGLFVAPHTTVSVVAEDAGAGVASSWRRVAGGPEEEGTVFSAGLPDGAYAVAFRSSDRLGNLEAAVEGTLLVDATAPTVAAVVPRPDAVVLGDAVVPTALPDCEAMPELGCPASALAARERPGFLVARGVVDVRADPADPEVNGVASGIARVRYELDGELLGVATEAPWSVPWNTTDAGGEHVLVATAEDHVGHATSVVVKVIVVPTSEAGAERFRAWAAVRAEEAAADAAALLPTVPDVPGAPDVPGDPDLPDVPGEPGLPDVPDDPGVPDVPDAPDLPDAPDAPDVPDVPDLPDVPDVPPTAVPVVVPVTSFLLDPTERRVVYRVGVEVDGQFVGREGEVDL